MLSEAYYTRVIEMLERIWKTQREALRQAAGLIAASLAQGQVLHLFGSGHSSLIAREAVGRAGGLVPLNDIYDPTEGLAERLEGYAAKLLEKYEASFGLRRGEVLIIISNSGINPLPIEMALEARKRGLTTIGITSFTYTKSAQSRHSSGQRLREVVDIALDNCGQVGDAMVEVPGLAQRVGPGSTIGGALLINLLLLEVIEQLLAAGQEPPILKSINLEGADEFNLRLRERYSGRLRWA